nr:hypothetical protein [Tanacetum cinerariifolium]
GSHWQKNFPLLVKKDATARRKVKPLPRRLHCYQKSRRNWCYDWSYQAEEEPASFALMDITSSSSSSDNE